MKVIKSRVFQFIITAIIFTGIGVFATSTITADQIQYNSTTTVKDKIDDLYTRQDQRIDQVTSQNGTLTTQNSSLTAQNGILTSQNETLASQNTECQNQLGVCNNKTVSFGTASYNQNQGYQNDRSTSLTLNQGKYIVLTGINLGTVKDTNTSTVEDYTIEITCSNTCNKQKLSGKWYNAVADTKIGNTNYYLRNSSRLNVYYMDITSSSTTITVSNSSTTGQTATHIAEGIILQAIPLNY